MQVFNFNVILIRPICCVNFQSLNEDISFMFGHRDRITMVFEFSILN